MNLEQARANMINQQVRSWEVLDERVLDILGEIAREEFVPARHRKLAFSDLRIPLGHDQVMMKPIEQGRMLQSLGLRDGERVLEIGTGSGFITACLSRLGGKVTSLEIVEELAEQARANLEMQSVEGPDIQVADALAADFDRESFDAVVVTSSTASVPEKFVEWLKPGGRMFIVRGYSPAMEAMLLTRTESGRVGEQSLFDTDLPRLIGAEDAPVFEF